MIAEIEKTIKDLIASAYPHIHIYSFASVDNMSQYAGEIIAPSISVILSNQTIVKSIDYSVILSQEWTLVCTTQTGANLTNLEQARGEAFEIYEALIKRLIAFNNLPKGYGNLKLSDAPVKSVSFDSIERFLLPLSFQVDYVINSDTGFNEPY